MGIDEESAPSKPPIVILADDLSGFWHVKSHEGFDANDQLRQVQTLVFRVAPFIGRPITTVYMEGTGYLLETTKTPIILEGQVVVEMVRTWHFERPFTCRAAFYQFNVLHQLHPQLVSYSWIDQQRYELGC